jgi:hypothetical protein
MKAYRVVIRFDYGDPIGVEHRSYMVGATGVTDAYQKLAAHCPTVPSKADGTTLPTAWEPTNLALEEEEVIA